MKNKINMVEFVDSLADWLVDRLVGWLILLMDELGHVMILYIKISNIRLMEEHSH